ncbi:CidA/LrgA family holin-like protein [Bacillus sp. SH5-2]|uniref:CidA/LrgA family holin-like protein n=1 Tax=Bacillus sp. SH5-2 TaxID=2217834 RepID=UPI0021069621|nr:CidA/LrgA family holin-like protein [Bacillus sp. SH5-2]
MKYVTLLLQVGVLYIFSLVGLWIQEVFQLSMPGSLIGMLILFLLLSTRILPLRWFELGAEKLIVFLPLFLIPSTTGLMEYGSFLFSKGSIIFLLVVASTVVTLIISWNEIYILKCNGDDENDNMVYSYIIYFWCS